MLNLYRLSLYLLLASCLLASGCSAAKDLGKTLSDLQVVRAELMKKFGEEDVGVHVNTFQHRTSISVTYINSALNQKTSEERGKRAQETAEIVRQLYPQIKDVSEIWIGFIRVTTRLVFFHYSEMIETRGFDVNARALVNSGARVDPTQPEIRYSASENKTEISSSGIPLEGTAENGVLLVSHFSVAGNVNRTTPVPPKEVDLDFAAFSTKPRFPNATKLVFISDNKVVYVTEGQFTASQTAAENYTEVLYLKVPTAAFLRISSGTTITIKLNEYEYALTGGQVLQIQRMSDYIR
jgi:hypothetical protein